jgi:hypothetical protein
LTKHPGTKSRHRGNKGHARLISSSSAQEARGLSFRQISDSHVGFDKPANPNALGTLEEAAG